MHALSFYPVILAAAATALGSCEMPNDAASDPEPGAELGGDASVSAKAYPDPWAEPEQSEPVTPAVEVQAAAPAPASEHCPSDMILIEGQHCPVVDQPCVTWMEDPAKFPYARCAEFSPEVKCKAERIPMRYCIDRLEAAEDSGLPVADTSWTQAAAACKANGKRLCKEREWLFACEGEQMTPYPYGLARDSTACNFEKERLVEKGELIDYRQPVTSNPKCVSPFGVQNMVGNIDEWVVLDKPYWTNYGQKMMSGLKGGWWGPLRNRCRPVTLDHDEYFHELQTGYRCCADAK
jgi:formylglycine-generating enzyme